MKKLSFLLLLSIAFISCQKDDQPEYFYVKTETENHITTLTITSSVALKSTTFGPNLLPVSVQPSLDAKTIIASVPSPETATSFGVTIVSTGNKAKAIEVQKLENERTVYYDFN